MTKTWIDGIGNQLGSTSDDVEDFPGAVEAITDPPESGTQTWNGSQWSTPPGPLTDEDIIREKAQNDPVFRQQIREAAQRRGVTPAQLLQTIIDA